MNRQCLYGLIYRGALKLPKDPSTGYYVFPVKLDTLHRLRNLRTGLIHTLDLTTEHQDA